MPAPQALSRARRREEEQRDWVQSARDLLQPMEVGRAVLPGA